VEPRRNPHLVTGGDKFPTWLVIKNILKAGPTIQKPLSADTRATLTGLLKIACLDGNGWGGASPTRDFEKGGGAGKEGLTPQIKMPGKLRLAFVKCS
jgi:hypothetical protein